MFERGGGVQKEGVWGVLPQEKTNSEFSILKAQIWNMEYIFIFSANKGGYAPVVLSGGGGGVRTPLAETLTLLVVVQQHFSHN